MSKFYEFKNKTEESADLFIYGDIINDEEARWYESDVSVKGFKEALDGLSDNSTLKIYINSGGGSVFAAVSMFNMLQRTKNSKNIKVEAFIDGLAASAASLFPFVADICHVYKNSIMMIHKPLLTYFFTTMNADDLRHEADVLDKIEEATLLKTYMSKVKDGTTEIQMSHLISNETWMSADEIIDKFDGFVMEEDERDIQNCTSKFFDKYRNTPERFKVEDKDPEEEKEPAGSEDGLKDETSISIDSEPQRSDADDTVNEDISKSNIALAKNKILKMKRGND